MGWLLHNWQAFVEIPILGVAMYFAAVLIRGTRGAPIVVGFLSVLLAVTAVTRALDLDVLGRLLGHFFTFAAVAVLVLFQPELRRMLGEVGSLRSFVSLHEQRENIEVIVQTTERLADVRIGMLIALEQTIHLQEAVESGIPVDCELTPEMLETIFFPNNAIHDGGVIVRGDRIAKAACIFPLTQRQDLSKSLGTRHRAAIGLSEETDAVVVVVSEETGAISYAYKGTFVRGVTLEELRSFLTSVIVPVPRPRTSIEARLRQWFSREPAEGGPGGAKARAPRPVLPPFLARNLGLKIASLVLATVVWIMVRGGAPTRLGPGTQRMFARQSITVLTAAADPYLFRVEPGTVAVRVAGPRDVLDRLQPREVQAFVDLTTITEARDLIKRVQVFVPAELSVVSVAPREVTVRALAAPALADPITRKVP